MLLQVVNQFVSAYGTQVQVDTGQRMVYDLRYRLFEHLQALGLHHHITTSTGDAVYRVDVDAYAIENLVMSGLFPLATSVITLTVMFGILLTLDVTIALLSLTVVPFLYLCLRYYTSTLVNREERVKELESKLIERLYETFWRDPAREELRARAVRARRAISTAGETDDERAHRASPGSSRCSRSSSRRSRFSARRSSSIVGGMHVMRGQMTIGDLIVVITYLGAVYGPLSAIAHTTGPAAGRARRRQARARDVRADAGNGGRARTPSTPPTSRATSASRTSASRTRTARRCCTTSRSRRSPGEMVALVGLTGAGKTTLVSLIPRFYDADGRAACSSTASTCASTACGRCASRIAIVLQDPVLFSGTIADNLRYGRLDATPRGDRGGGARRARARLHRRACRRATRPRSPRPAAACRAASASA